MSTVESLGYNFVIHLYFEGVTLSMLVQFDASHETFRLRLIKTIKPELLGLTEPLTVTYELSITRKADACLA